jgi:hypothetical protein
LISFDIDGTLEVGDPPGCVTMRMVRSAKDLGYIIGSCSDRMVSNQRRIWRDHDIAVQFTVLKHQLDMVRAEFEAESYYHIGDTNIDRHYAERAGFEFFLPGNAVAHFWLPLRPSSAPNRPP